MVLTIGQYIHRKGFDVLLKAAKNIELDVGFYIIGGTPNSEYIELAETAGLERIHFLEFMSKESLEDYFRAANIFVLPTREDVWGLVINEAMAHALPVITTNKCIAGLEMINKSTGAIIESDNSIKLSEAIMSFIEQEDTNIRGLNGQKFIEHYTFEEMARVHRSIFQEV